MKEETIMNKRILGLISIVLVLMLALVGCT